jgi:hypothetical protein
VLAVIVLTERNPVLTVVNHPSFVNRLPVEILVTFKELKLPTNELKLPVEIVFVLSAANRPSVPVILPLDTKSVLIEEITAVLAVIVLAVIVFVKMLVVVTIVVFIIPDERKFVVRLLINAVVPMVKSEFNPAPPAPDPTTRVDVYIDPFTSKE